MKVEKRVDLPQNVEKLVKKVGKVVDIEDVNTNWRDDATIKSGLIEISIVEQYSEVTGEAYYRIVLTERCISPISRVVPRSTALNIFDTHVDFEVLEGTGPMGDEDSTCVEWIVYNSKKDFQQFKNQFKAILDFIHNLGAVVGDNGEREIRKKEKGIIA